MSYPKVTFALNKEYDKASILEFIDDKDEFLDFGHERIIQFYPELETIRGQDTENQRVFISDYVDRYYAEHFEELELSAKKLQDIWDEVADQYFSEVEKLFGRLDFYTVKEIKASPSITNCGDIADDFTRFHIWYKRNQNAKEVKRSVAHEVLHFYYYTFVRVNNFQILANQWDLAEIFNRVILGLPQFLNIIELPDFGYEQHDRYMKYYEKVWKGSASLNEYLIRTNTEGLMTNPTV